MRRRIIRILMAVVIIYTVALGIQVGLTALHAKSYVASLSGEYDRTTLDNQSNQVASDVNRLFTLLSVPVVIVTAPRHSRMRRLADSYLASYMSDEFTVISA